MSGCSKMAKWVGIAVVNADTKEVVHLNGRPDL